MSKKIDDICVTDPEETLGKEDFGDDYVQPSLFMHLIKSLMPGQDLTRVLIPVFFLESRSILEKFTDTLMHVNLLEDPTLVNGNDIDRFLCLTKYFLSGWHYKTKGAKKPYNPIIGETFACKVKGEKYTFSYISEQVIHHPPISAFYCECPELNFKANGQIWTKSKFLGNSAKSILDGEVKINIGNDLYILTYPNFIATGLFIGTLTTQLCDESVIRCVNTGIECKLKWHEKPMIWGDYNCVTGEIYQKGTKICTLNGKWNESFKIKYGDGPEKPFLNIEELKIYPKLCLDIPYQGEYESRRLWNVVTSAIRKTGGPDWNAVEVEKTRLENDQRDLPVHQTGEKFKEWDRKLFHLEKDEDLKKEVWVFNDPLQPGKVPERDLLIISRDSSEKDPRVKDFKKTKELLEELSKDKKESLKDKKEEPSKDKKEESSTNKAEELPKDKKEEVPKDKTE